MKKVCACLAASLFAGALFAFAGCDGLNSADTNSSGSDRTEIVNPLSALDKIDITRAFGDFTADDWTVALGSSTDMTVKLSASSKDLLGNTVKSCSLSAGAKIGFSLGLCADETQERGVGLFGTGEAELNLAAEGNGKVYEQDFRAAVGVEGGLLHAVTESTNFEYDLYSLAERAESAAKSFGMGRLYQAVEAVPAVLANGFGLRFGVEKLIDLGFVVEIDTAEGTKITVRASEALFTDLLNDLIETVAPSVTFLPRIDLAYRSTVLALELDFDEENRFEKFALRSDVSVSASLQVPLVSTYCAGIELAGGFEITAI